MYDQVNLTELRRVVSLAEETPEFDPDNRVPHQFTMGDWLCNTSCGTAGCLIGTYALKFGYYSSAGVDTIGVRKRRTG